MTEKCEECRRYISTRNRKCGSCGHKNAANKDTTATLIHSATEVTPAFSQPQTLENLSLVDTLTTVPPVNSDILTGITTPTDISIVMEKLNQVLNILAKMREKNAMLRKENAALKAENECLQLVSKRHSEEIEELKEHMNDLEQYTRRNNVIVSGIPMKEGENVEKIVVTCARAGGLPWFTENEIDVCHRLPTGMPLHRVISS